MGQSTHRSQQLYLATRTRLGVRICPPMASSLCSLPLKFAGIILKGNSGDDDASLFTTITLVRVYANFVSLAGSHRARTTDTARLSSTTSTIPFTSTLARYTHLVLGHTALATAHPQSSLDLASRFWAQRWVDELLLFPEVEGNKEKVLEVRNQ